jgi:hypothetical protein
MVRLEAIVVLWSVLTATPAVGQVPVGVYSSARFPSWSVTAESADSVSPRLGRITLPPAAAEGRHKSPVLAWFLSWIVPGGGQAYNGQWGKAAGFFIPALAGFALVVSSDGFSCSDSCGTRDAGLVVLAVSSIGSQIEAPIAASKINRQSRKTSSPQVGLIIARIGF